MRRIALVIFFLVAACFAAFAAKPDLPTINGIPALFGTIASGTGTATEYLEYRPVAVGADGSILTSMSGVSSSVSVSSPTYPTGYRIISTPDTIISLPGTVKTNLVASLPTDCVGFSARFYGDDVVTNCHTDLATSPFVVGDITASGSVFRWDGPAGGGNIFAIPRNGLPATATIWGWR